MPYWSRFCRFSLFVAFGVGRLGDDKHPPPMVRCAGVGSLHDTPPRVIPHPGQVSENSAKCPQSAVWFVSHTDRAGFHTAICCRTE
jgi:hypothetical protein